MPVVEASTAPVPALIHRASQSSAIQQFLSLVSDPFKSSFQYRAFWVSLATYLGITLVLTLLFSLFRPRNTVIYAPKTKYVDKKHAPPPLGRGFFSWLRPVFKMKEAECFEKIGMDATIFLRVTRMCRNIFCVLAVLGCAILIPINVKESDDRISDHNSVLTLMTPMFVFNASLWSHVVCAWVFNAIVAFFLFQNYRAIAGLRKRYFQSPEYRGSLHARTVLIRHIPKDFRSDEGILHITDAINPTASIPQASIGRNVKGLPQLFAEHEDTVKQLEEVLAKYFRNPDKLPAKRPTCKPSKGYIDLNQLSSYHRKRASKVDAIDYLTDRIRRLEAEIKLVRASVDTTNAMNYGFASWRSIEAAHLTAYIARKIHPHKTTITLAPRPSDLIWDNLPLSHAAVFWKRLVDFFWSVVLTLLYIVPNALIAVFLTNMSNLTLVWPAFQREMDQSPQFWAAVQGIAAPAITSLVYLILPIIFRRMATRSGDITKTRRETKVISRLYAFFVFNNLIVFSLFSTIWGFVSTVVNESSQKKPVWDALDAGDLYVKVMTTLCQTSPFWVTYILQRNLGAATDLIMLFGMVWRSFKRRFLSPTPREEIEATAPPSFQYAVYYNYFLFYSTIALSFATLQPIILPFTAIYFAIDACMKKYLLLYVFVTKTESGGLFWKPVFNRFIFACVFADCIIAIVVKARGTWTMVYALAPLPILMISFYFICGRIFDNNMLFCAKLPGKKKLPAAAIDIEEDADTFSQASIERLNARFGHPTLYGSLMTPMVHAKAANTLDSILSSRSVSTAPGLEEDLSSDDIALHDMKKGAVGTKSIDISEAESRSSSHKPGFEVVDDNQLDFVYFKERPEFKDYVGASGIMYGQFEDTMIDRSMTGTPATYAEPAYDYQSHRLSFSNLLHGPNPVSGQQSFANATKLRHAAAAGFDISRAVSPALNPLPQPLYDKPHPPAPVTGSNAGGYLNSTLSASNVDVVSASRNTSQESLLDETPRRAPPFALSPRTEQQNYDYNHPYSDLSDINLRIQEPESLALQDAGSSRNRQSFNYYHPNTSNLDLFNNAYTRGRASRSQSPMSDDGAGRTSPLPSTHGNGYHTYNYGESQYR